MRRDLPRFLAGAGTRAALALSVLLWVAGVAGAEALGDFEAHGDVGSPAIAGSATYNAASQEYRLSAAGVNMWGTRDEFQFVWKRLEGDFLLRARVEFLGEGVDPHRKLGLIIRGSLDDDAPYADAVVHGDGLTSLQWRREKGGETEQIEAPLTAAEVIQIERKGDRITFSAARFGDTFTPLSTELALGDAVYAGLFLCSHDPDVVERAVFRNVRIVRPAPDGFTPYRDYIGSRLELLDVATGYREVVATSATDPFEAPNWTTDGRALIYNASGNGQHRGRLFRFDLATRVASLIDTGDVVRNNNDHVLTFDGTMLGISSSTADEGSTIFTLPSGGGTPKRITRRAPSYLHGWSPDAKYLVYTAGRDDQFDIYRIPADGSGEEENLTRLATLDDGPEYSADGKYIYFNSVRTGSMEIWRMGPNGENPEQLTDDAYNNWFPHLSPDGRWFVYIAFPEDIDPSDHPYYRHVYLRLMPADGGEAKTIAYLYGGQGTINVPSWSPDGTFLAFVSNSRLD
jgi:hypothetical protein